jgi:4-hydroxybenzoate polyprenyltransferase
MRASGRGRSRQGSERGSGSVRSRRHVAGLLGLLRPRHWVKNAFVLAPLVFSLPAVAPAEALKALAAAVAFSLVSSAVYALNDVVDRDADRRSPARKHRPVASGEVSIAEAGGLAAACALAAAVLAFLLPWRTVAAIAGYVLVNVAYSLRLKRIVLIDVMAIAAGFMLRVYAGAAALGVVLSSWMALTTFFVSLFLGFSKRRSELTAVGGRASRAVLEEYTEPLLDVLIVMSVSITIVTYSLYVIQAAAGRGRGAVLVGTVPLVVYGLIRYLYLVMRRGKGGDVADVLIRDAPLVVTVAAWAVEVVVVLLAVP